MTDKTDLLMNQMADAIDSVNKRLDAVGEKADSLDNAAIEKATQASLDALEQINAVKAADKTAEIVENQKQCKKL